MSSVSYAFLPGTGLLIFAAKMGSPLTRSCALYIAIHGGGSKNDKIDSEKIASMLRGGMFPLAYVYSKEMRATRDLLRRREYFVRLQAELFTHIQNTNSQYNFDATLISGRMRFSAYREQLPAHFNDPVAQ